MESAIDAITRTLEFTHPIERVWQAITDPREVGLWFGSSAHFDLVVGSTGYFEWAQECEGKFAMRIEAIKPRTYFAWRWMHQQDEIFVQLKSTLVEWHLQETSSGTRLRMVESGFAELKHRQMNSEGWDEELGDLMDYLSA